MSDSVERDMDPTPRRRRSSNEFDTPNMSGDSSSGTGEETDKEELERLRRENEELRRRGNVQEEEHERLKREEEEMKNIEKFVQEYPGKKSELEKIIKQLGEIGDDSVTPVNPVTQGGVVLAVGGLTASSLFTAGASLPAGAVGAGIASAAGIAFMGYINSKIARLGKEIKTYMADVCVLLSAASKAVSKISKISKSVLDRAPNLKKLHGAIESNPGLVKLIEDDESSENRIASVHPGTAAALRAPLSQSAVPGILDAILNENTNTSVRAAQIEECVRQVESELEAVDKMYSEMQKLVTV